MNDQPLLTNTKGKTMEPNFTPGPWQISHYGQHFEITTVTEEVGKYRHITNDCPVLAGPNTPSEIYKGVRVSSEAIANLRLMAAAPELYAALESLRDEIRRAVKFDVRKHYSLMVADVAADNALRKARGEA